MFRPSQCLHGVAVVVLHGDVTVYSSPVVVYRDCSSHSTTHNVQFVCSSAVYFSYGQHIASYLYDKGIDRSHL